MLTIAEEKEVRFYLKHISNKRFPSNLPIEVEEGDAKPYLAGESWHYQTKGGRYIRYPSAYSKIGYSNMVYVNSTRHIKVGRKWIKQIAIDIEQLRLSKMRGKIVNRTLAEFSINAL